ncbi:MAG: hypothetical protein HGA49_09590 [Eubacteriaceae bacterium]|nr:hypothetical protein [Eubacteriaceae bacterium]
MDSFIISLSGITTLLNPVMTFIMLMTIVFFTFYLKEKFDKMENYIRSIAISLQNISQQISKHE